MHSCTILFLFIERNDNVNIQVYTQASIKLTGCKRVYIDPYQLMEKQHDADYIFITHEHYDHYDEESIKNALNDKTLLIVPACLKECASKITKNVFVVEPNKTYTLDEITFDTIPAYNKNKPYHPKENDYVGYNITIDKTKYYIMGDTDRTEETDTVKTDVCFVPIGGTYTMNVEEAISCINHIKPKKVIPIHYGSIVGTKSLGQEFKEKIDKEIEVEIQI